MHQIKSTHITTELTAVKVNSKYGPVVKCLQQVLVYQSHSLLLWSHSANHLNIDCLVCLSYVPQPTVILFTHRHVLHSTHDSNTSISSVVVKWSNYDTPGCATAFLTICPLLALCCQIQEKRLRIDLSGGQSIKPAAKTLLDGVRLWWQSQQFKVLNHKVNSCLDHQQSVLAVCWWSK